MLQAVFQHHITFVVVALLVTAFTIVAVAVAARRTGRPLVIGAFAGAVMAVLALTLWSTGSSDIPPTCVINHDVLEPFGELQGQLNCAMFVPVGLLGVLATRRAWPVMLFGTALSAGIELTQGLLPIIGRSCDTSDFAANATGAIAGTLLGWLLITLDRRPRVTWGPHPRTVAIGFSVFTVATAATWAGFIQSSNVAQTTVGGSADARQTVAVTQAVHQAFGEHYSIQRIKFFAGPDGTGTVTAYLPVGFLQMNWPAGNDITATIEPGTPDQDSAFPVTPVSTQSISQRDAQPIATAYARQHYPWGLPDTRVEVDPVGEHAALGWVVSWRHYRAGILMPMRLDIEIDRHGRVSQLHALQASDPALPTVTVRPATAAALASKSEPSCGRATPTVLMAMQTQDGAWIPAWRVTLTCGQEAGLVVINAHAATVLSHLTFPAQAAPTDPANGD